MEQEKTRRFKVIGKSLPRLDGLETVSGQALYTAVRLAAADAKRQLLEAASRLSETPLQDLRLGRKEVLGKRGKSLSFAEIVQRSFADEKTIVGKGCVEDKLKSTAEKILAHLKEP